MRPGIRKKFTALTATGQTEAVTTALGAGFCKTHSIQADITGSPTDVQGKLEGSLDGGKNPTNWFDLSGTLTFTAGDLFHIVNKAVANVRFNLTVLTGGTSPTVTPIYVGSIQ